MAAAFVTPTVKKTWADSAYHAILTLAIGASPLTYTTGGVPCNLNTALNKASQNAPLIGIIEGQSGYVYQFVPGADNSAGLLKIFVQGAAETDPLEEMANALAIPAGVSGDVITGYFIYLGME